MGYVDYEVPKELVPQIIEMLSVAKDGGKIKKGVNEATKSIERKSAQLVVVAADVTPEEVVVHLPMLCKEHNIPYTFVPTKKELGVSVGLEVGTSAIAVENAGPAAEKLQDIIKKLPKHEKKK
ncbi:50S ribosomal protein L7ae [Candidatus Micrarchaeota archaeon]|nr:50S ribosomal protein L7ae [Candidatus Micrarchaeota archaeon]